jgi:hypothetical protein
MTAVVFLGPTLPIAEARLELDAVYLPPVAQGDVYRATLQRPHAIGIVDGYFDRVPAVWHKEILWALSRGIRVFGAASMGALRAAELEPFSMEGVGAIFAAYRDGVLRDDDEVAITHAGADEGYRSASEAMVNIRRTLGQAAAEQVISRQTLLVLQRLAKEMFYPERSYGLLLERAAAVVPGSELARLRAWLPQGRADQKRDDALAMLRTMREALASPRARNPVFTFAYTAFWDRLRLTVAQHDPTAASNADGDVALVLDELRSDEQAYRAARAAALLRVVGLDKARRHGLTVPDAARSEEAEQWGTHPMPATPGEWLDRQGLDAVSRARLAAEDALLERVEAFMQQEVAGALIDHLKLTGAYGDLLQRARAKQSLLDEEVRGNTSANHTPPG